MSTLAPKHTTNSGFLTVGTSAYMAPEAHRGVISILLDSFSFGVVLLELLTSLPPIDEARDEVDLVGSHVISMEIIHNGSISLVSRFHILRSTLRMTSHRF